MALQPFIWGQGGEKVSPQEAARQREMAQAVLGQNSSVASNPWEGLAQVARATTSTVLGGRASEAERIGQEEAAAIFGGLGPDSDLASLLSAAQTPWASPEQKAIAQLLIGRDFQEQDQQTAWAREDALRADDRAYQSPFRDAQLQGLNLGNETAAFDLDQKRNPAPKPLPFEVINNQVVQIDPMAGTTRSIGDFATPEPGFRLITPEEAVANNLDPAKSWQVGPDSRVYEVGNSGVNITNNLGGEQTPGWKKIDETFGETYLDWVSGGWADTQKQLEQLGEAASILDTGTDVTGTIGLLPREVAAFVNPDGTIARENVEEVVQRSLREILGAQFTEKEGERLIARAFNPLLSPAENKKRVNRLLGTIQGMAESKQGMVDYFDQNGTLRGYEGQKVRASELDALANEFGESPSESPSENQSVPSQSAPMQSTPPELTQQQYESAPSGTVFKAPDGSIRVKP